MTDVFRRNRPWLVSLLLIVLLVVLLVQQYEPRIAVSILLSGLTLGALYFLVTSGLSLIFGLMDVLNFAHGLFFMLGAYVGYTLYANPRMLLNTVPFGLALGGAATVGVWVTTLLRARTLPETARKAVVIVAGLAGGAIALMSVWGFDLLKLAASSEITAGGAVPTELAQESAAQYMGRLAWLLVAGVVLGVALGYNQKSDRRGSSRAWLAPLLGVVVAGLAFALVPARTGGEELILGLSSNVRFLLALIVGALGGAGVGALVETSMIRPLYARPIYQVLLTLGLVFVGTEVIRAIWGPAGFYMDIPAYFNTSGAGCRPPPDIISWFGLNCASINIMGRPFPSYRLFVIVLGIVMFVAIALLLRRTRMGMIIRAGVQDRDMVQALGINVRRVFTLVFALGTGLAALGGVAAAPFVGVNPGLGQEFLLLAFIAVVIGGMGSYTGAAIGALLVGLARAFGDQLVLSGIMLPGMEEALKFSPSIARASTVLLMAAVLLIRPAGLFGRKES
jgi:branched-chain amino acid transport system permease protein